MYSDYSDSSSSSVIFDDDGGSSSIEDWSEPAPFQWEGSKAPAAEAWVVAEPHTNTPFEAIGSGGFAIATLGLCLLGGRLASNVLYPLAAVGSISLTAYSFHVVLVAFHPEWVGGDSWGPLLSLILLTVILAFVWKHFFTRGPLEWVMWKVSIKAAGD